MIVTCDPEELTDVLLAAQKGEGLAREQIAAWMFSKTQAQVRRAMRGHRTSLTVSSLQSHVLIRLIRGNTIDRAPDLGYLLGAIARATREILVDYYRREAARQRHIARGIPDHLPWFRQVIDEQNLDLRELELALQELEEIHPRKAIVVTLRFFCEMSVREIGSELSISKSTVESDLRLARAWLYRRLNSPFA